MTSRYESRKVIDLKTRQPCENEIILRGNKEILEEMEKCSHETDNEIKQIAYALHNEGDEYVLDCRKLQYEKTYGTVQVIETLLNDHYSIQTAYKSKEKTLTCRLKESSSK
ncbi:hypothetical protein KTC96_14220 [Clostridium estertheticum]|uniref:hypothetical protein n=1 Tax=Clostridium estertheticum TaxID=238834 RepID=UPI001C7E1586|nr:hypothetical protein [Clostridium estertheticum]MBX4258849.1 hypothetical protein [Clostridium estertheticum]WLC69145.1 hypothetical protein KTC96_14220 [Clostridium estertheticum]